MEADLDDVDPFIDLMAKLALYRIVQEALSNVRRHAGPCRTTVRLHAADGHVIAEIADDGHGFDPDSPMALDRGLGLVGMRERASMVGGRLHIESARGAGTSVRASVPFHSLEDGDV